MSEVVGKTKKPFGFYVCSIGYMFERMAYYSAKYLIYVFITATVITGGLGLTKVQAALVQSNLVAFTYLAPVIGGYISDRWIGARYCVPVGITLMGAGYWMGSSATGIVGMNLMVALVAIGTGLFKGNLAAMSGALFTNKKDLDSAFSTQYSFINIGAFIGTTAVGILVTTTFANGDIQGFRQAFKVCTLICAIDLVWILYGMRFLGDVGKKPFKAGKNAEEEIQAKADASRPLTKSEKKRTAAIIIVSLFSIVFWVFWYLTYLAAYDYGGTFIDMNVSGFQVPLSWFDSLNSMSCIILGPILGILWFKLSKRPQGDMSLFKKLAFGLIFLGIAFLMLVFAEITRGVGAPESAKAGLGWLMAFGFLLTIGEMFFSPLGSSFVTKYAPNKIFSVLMGIWFFATFFAGKSYGYVYAITTKFSPIVSYSVIPAVLFVCAVLLFVFDGKLMQLLKEEPEQIAEEVFSEKVQ